MSRQSDANYCQLWLQANYQYCHCRQLHNSLSGSISNYFRGLCSKMGQSIDKSNDARVAYMHSILSTALKDVCTVGSMTQCCIAPSIKQQKQRCEMDTHHVCQPMSNAQSDVNKVDVCGKHHRLSPYRPIHHQFHLSYSTRALRQFLFPVSSALSLV